MGGHWYEKSIPARTSLVQRPSFSVFQWRACVFSLSAFMSVRTKKLKNDCTKRDVTWCDGVIVCSGGLQKCLDFGDPPFASTDYI